MREMQIIDRYGPPEVNQPRGCQLQCRGRQPRILVRARVQQRYPIRGRACAASMPSVNLFTIYAYLSASAPKQPIERLQMAGRSRRLGWHHRVQAGRPGGGVAWLQVRTARGICDVR